MLSRRSKLTLLLVLTPLVIAVPSCAPEYRPWWLGGTGQKASLFSDILGATFSEELLDARTFTDGHAVTTVTHYVDDMDRRRVAVDFNGDGKVDPVTAYGDKIGVMQIMMSQGGADSTEFLSLSLDGGDNAWFALLDVAVGDIDGDGRFDLIGASRDGVIYLRHPPRPYQTEDLRYWGAASGDLEIIAGTDETLTADEQLAIITQAVGPGANLDNYTITIEQGYTNVEIGDLNNDGFNDIVASRRLRINLEPAPDKNVEPLLIVAGSLQVLLNPGAAQTGEGWSTTIVSQHERHSAFDREGAQGIWLHDLDGDGDLDIVSAAEDDLNAQVAWFENPGGPGPFDPSAGWTQYRVGSLRAAVALDVADLTLDGQVDIVAVSAEAYEARLFVQPNTGPKREYDWDTATIITFENFQPFDVKALDVDNDAELELVIGASEGAIRYFDSPENPMDVWEGTVAATINPPGDVGLLGYGDVDGDLDLDLIAVVNGQDANDDRLIWIRNELLR